MGIRAWLKRVFGKSDPGVPCNLCHCAIPAEDFQEGIAVVIARKQFCGGCVEEITRRAASQPGWTLSADLGSSSTVFLR